MTPLQLSIALGIVGALTRIAVQIIRDGKLPDSAPRVVSLIFLGAVSGGIAYLLNQGEIVAISLGYTGSDAIENLLSNAYPKNT